MNVNVLLDGQEMIVQKHYVIVIVSSMGLVFHPVFVNVKMDGVELHVQNQFV